MELPSWFDLKNYESLSNLTIEQWAKVIYTRYELVNSLNQSKPRTHRNAQETDNATDDYLTILAAISRAPFSHSTTDSYPALRKPVSHLDIDDLIELWGTISPKILDSSRYAYADKETADFSFIENTIDSALALEKQQLINQAKTFLSIDLTAPDQHLFDSFKIFLKNEREKRKHYYRNKNFQQSDINRWLKQRCIQFFDLSLYLKITNTDESLQAIGLAIFPEDYDVALSERIRKTTKPLTEALISEQTVRILEAQLNKYPSKKS